jgi:hypothetical protein
VPVVPSPKFQLKANGEFPFVVEAAKVTLCAGVAAFAEVKLTVKGFTCMASENVPVTPFASVMINVAVSVPAAAYAWLWV